MKRKILLLAVLAILPVMAFAQLGFGPAMFLKSPVLIGQAIDATRLSSHQFSFGGDARFRLAMFQAEGLVLFSVGNYSSFDVFLDAGVAFDIAILTLSAGVGPNFASSFGRIPANQAGLNAKVGADINLGKLSVGMPYIMALDINNIGFDIRSSSGLLGIQAVFWM